MALLRRLERARPESLAVVSDDAWRVLADDQPVPATGDIVVPLVRWQRERESLRARSGRLGVRIPNDASTAVLAALSEDAALVAIEIPRLRDGRAYTLAHWLRTRFGFEGELRAVGVVARDQLLFLSRVGFDAFDLSSRSPHEISPEEALAALGEQSVFYQAAADLKLPLWKRAARG